MIKQRFLAPHTCLQLGRINWVAVSQCLVLTCCKPKSMFLCPGLLHWIGGSDSSSSGVCSSSGCGSSSSGDGGGNSYSSSRKRSIAARRLRRNSKSDRRVSNGRLMPRGDRKGLTAQQTLWECRHQLQQHTQRCIQQQGPAPWESLAQQQGRHPPWEPCGLQQEQLARFRRNPWRVKSTVDMKRGDEVCA